MEVDHQSCASNGLVSSATVIPSGNPITKLVRESKYHICFLPKWHWRSKTLLLLSHFKYALPSWQWSPS